MICAFLLLALLVAGGPTAPPAAGAWLEPVTKIGLDGVEGRIDHLDYDAESGRLFVAALGNDTVEVIDVAKGARLPPLDLGSSPTGLAVMANIHRVAVASGGAGKCSILDESLSVVATVGDLEDADNVRYDPGAKLLYVGYGEGALAVIDPVKGKLLASIALAAHPESFQLEAKGPRLFVNVPGARHIAVVDRDKRKVIATWPLKDARWNYPMALDENDHLLFVGCRRPSSLLVIDTHDGHVVSRLPCCGDADDIFWDAPRRRIYVSGGEGCLDVFTRGKDNHFTKAKSISTAPGARTSLFVPATRRLFLAVPKRNGQHAEVRIFKAQ